MNVPLRTFIDAETMNFSLDDASKVLYWPDIQHSISLFFWRGWHTKTGRESIVELKIHFFGMQKYQK